MKKNGIFAFGSRLQKYSWCSQNVVVIKIVMIVVIFKQKSKQFHWHYIFFNLGILTTRNFVIFLLYNWVGKQAYDSPGGKWLP